MKVIALFSAIVASNCVTTIAFTISPSLLPKSNRLTITSLSNNNDGIPSDLDDDNINVNKNFGYTRRSVLSTTTGVIASSILASKSNIEPANAADNENGIPLTSLVEKIEKGKYFGTDLVKMKNLEPLYKPNSNGAPEKHLPKVVVNGNDIEISVNHVMTDEHYIQFIWLRDVDSDEVVLVKGCSPSEEKPYLKARVPSGVTLSPCLYCNLHGLWKGEPFTVA